MHETYLSFLVYTVHFLSSLAKHCIGFFPRSDIKNQRAKTSLTLLCARGLYILHDIDVPFGLGIHCYANVVCVLERQRNRNGETIHC